MNNQTHRFYVGRWWSVFLIISFGFLTAIGISGATRNPVGDFDGDGKTDISVFRPSDGYWYIAKSSGGYSFIPWGLSTDTPVPGDYDGDGKFDLAVCRRAGLGTPWWYILKSSDNSFSAVRFDSGYVVDFRTPTPADYDGDGKTDIATYNLTDILTEPPTFYVNESSTGRWVIGRRGNDRSDVQAPADYDGDGKTDYAFYRSGIWTIIQSSNGQTRFESFGLSSDKLVPADYDGDGKADIAVWRPSNGYWYWIASGDNSFHSFQFGLSDDKPVMGDYDGDGKTDIAVFRPSNGVWYLQQSTKGFRAEQFGLSGDIPIPNVFVH